MPKQRTQPFTAQVQTTNATSTQIYVDENPTGNAFYTIEVWAKETTSLTRSDSAYWHIIAVTFVNSEASVSVASEARDVRIGASSWAVEVQIDGGLLEVNVSGEASVDIDWECRVTVTTDS